MEYNKILDDIIMRPRHKFIYGSDLERSTHLKSLTKEYSFKADTLAPVAVYMTEHLEKCENKLCDMDKVVFFNKSYFEITAMKHILDHLLKEMPAELKQKLESNMLRIFNYGAKRPIISLEELIGELEMSRQIYFEEYHHYIKTGQLNNFIDGLRIDIVVLEMAIRNIKNSLPSLEYISLMIDQIESYSTVYMQVINFYINARSNGILNINVGCKDFSEWETLIDLNGNNVQYGHDFIDVNIEDYILKRKK